MRPTKKTTFFLNWLKPRMCVSFYLLIRIDTGQQENPSSNGKAISSSNISAFNFRCDCDANLLLQQPEGNIGRFLMILFSYHPSKCSIASNFFFFFFKNQFQYSHSLKSWKRAHTHTHIKFTKNGFIQINIYAFWMLKIFLR